MCHMFKQSYPQHVTMTSKSSWELYSLGCVFFYSDCICLQTTQKCLIVNIRFIPCG